MRDYSPERATDGRGFVKRYPSIDSHPRQESCKVRGLVHFSAGKRFFAETPLAEYMDLSPLRWDFAALLHSRPLNHNL
jgi:hypothetical protein